MKRATGQRDCPVFMGNPSQRVGGGEKLAQLQDIAFRIERIAQYQTRSRPLLRQQAATEEQMGGNISVVP